jgi:nitroreductase
MEINSTIQSILNRKSVRSYNEKPVSDEILLTLSKAALSAPSAVDKRPTELIVIKDKAILKKCSEVLPYARMTEKAAAAIVVCGNLTQQHGGEQEDFWLCDCSAAIQNILIGAESLGLGAVWTAVYPEKSRIESLRSILDFPWNIIPLALIPVGYPTGKEKPKDKFDTEKIHINQW